MLYTAPAEILKSETKFDKNRIWVLIKASDETLDQENDNVLSEAFTEELKKSFVEAGIFDWDHITIRGDNFEEKGTAIIGTPTEFYEKNVKGNPTQLIKGFLHRGNPYVDKTIEPCLRAGSDRIAASIGGRLLKSFPNEHGGKSVTHITMNHLAFTPKWKSVNYNTSVKLLKAKGRNGEDIYEFPTTKSLLKSLEAGTETDVAKISGGQAIQPQSLEGCPIDKDIPKKTPLRRELKGIAKSIFHDIVSGMINADFETIRNHCYLYGLNRDESNLISDLIMQNYSERIEKLKKAASF